MKNLITQIRTSFLVVSVYLSSALCSISFIVFLFTDIQVAGLVSIVCFFLLMLCLTDIWQVKLTSRTDK